MDKFSKNKRSEIMSKIRSSKTSFENRFASELRKKTSKKFKTNVENIKGKPDIVFKSEKYCIFLDSDFWHGWQYPRWKDALKNDFWKNKIRDNRKRDKKTTSYLRKNGWKVLRIWGHQINKEFEKAVDRVVKNIPQ